MFIVSTPTFFPFDKCAFPSHLAIITFQSFQHNATVKRTDAGQRLDREGAGLLLSLSSFELWYCSVATQLRVHASTTRVKCQKVIRSDECTSNIFKPFHTKHWLLYTGFGAILEHSQRTQTYMNKSIGPKSTHSGLATFNFAILNFYQNVYHTYSSSISYIFLNSIFPYSETNKGSCSITASC